MRTPLDASNGDRVAQWRRRRGSHEVRGPSRFHFGEKQQGLFGKRNRTEPAAQATALGLGKDAIERKEAEMPCRA